MSMDVFEMQKVVESANSQDLWLDLLHQSFPDANDVTTAVFDSISPDRGDFEVVLRTNTVYYGLSWNKIRKYFS